MRAMHNSRKLRVLGVGVAVAAALTTAACDAGASDGKDDGTTSPSATRSSAAPRTPSKPAAATSDTSDGKGDGGHADRQTPPTGSVCDHDGQGPYGAIESVNMGGESPYPVVGLVLGRYECADAGPTFVPTSATGAASNVFVDTDHLKVVVGGTLASDLGTRTPSPDAFLDALVKKEDRGELRGRSAPRFYFRIDAASDDVNAMPDDDSHIIYLYQLTDGG
ncbi:hypothetical protein G3I40_08915 [Streptomyces sp. SID14478]|uniref:hypothetical protein n=1 Tax=Streptomyces sp. SID14478 TaxID=2706073 RepID=UPI0013DB9499|nr:hypothetical protein [Streptomyces sp. SID14478]NEB75348.1 hypothetical protein [Streptomyces sp. SID14478]